MEETIERCECGAADLSACRCERTAEDLADLAADRAYDAAEDAALETDVSW